MADQTLAVRLASHPQPILVDVWAPWCAPCRRMAPIVERLQAEYQGRVDVWKINADEQQEDVRALGVFGIPTLVAFHAGKEIVRKTGAGSEAELRLLFESALSGERPTRRSIGLTDRLLRLAAGSAVVVLGLGTGPSLLLLALGGIILFTAVADRCPVWQAVRARLLALVGRRTTDQRRV